MEGISELTWQRKYSATFRIKDDKNIIHVSNPYSAEILQGVTKILLKTNHEKVSYKCKQRIPHCCYLLLFVKGTVDFSSIQTDVNSMYSLIILS